MRILLICDDYWHPGNIPADGISPLGDNGFQFDVITNARDYRPGMLSDYSAVILAKCDQVSKDDESSWKTGEVQNDFISYVENGGGLLAVHSGIDAGKETEALDRLIGCRIINHPNACPVTVQPVKPHPVTEGVELFCEVDEHYRLEIISPDIDILMASYSPECICPAAYVRTQKKGRVCVLTPGHNLSVWLNPQFQKTLVNALNWCAKA